MTPGLGSNFTPKVKICALLVEACRIKLHANFGSPKPYGYVRVDSKSFPLYAHVKLLTPWERAKFEPRAIIRAPSGRDPYIKLHAKFDSPSTYS